MDVNFDFGKTRITNNKTGSAARWNWIKEKTLTLHTITHTDLGL